MRRSTHAMGNAMKGNRAKREIKVAGELLAQGFCKYNMAQTADGHLCDPTAPEAAKFCAWGALERATGGPKGNIKPHIELLHAQLPKLYRRYYGEGLNAVVMYNNADLTTQADMVALFERAAS